MKRDIIPHTVKLQKAKTIYINAIQKTKTKHTHRHTQNRNIYSKFLEITQERV